MKLFVLLFLLPLYTWGQQDTIKVYFLYGSKPAKEYRKTEKKRFGGIHGGHVSIGVDTSIIGFSPRGKFHIFATDKNRNSAFWAQGLSSFQQDTVGNRFVVISIPVSAEDYQKIQDIHYNYMDCTPYDYAFLGMRCAAASYDVLSQLDILEKRNRWRTKFGIFYPKILRKKMLKLAKERGYKVYKQRGSARRKWEKD